IFQLHIGSMNTKKISLKPIVDKTTGFSGAEIKATCVEAGMIAIRQSRGHITQEDFIESIKRINLKKIQGGLKDTPESMYN
ncbi:MAG TPA: proteasome-activating nucleotidase, partial [Candidatus Poseidoniales archaeon]